MMPWTLFIPLCPPALTPHQLHSLLALSCLLFLYKSSDPGFCSLHTDGSRIENVDNITGGQCGTGRGGQAILSAGGVAGLGLWEWEPEMATGQTPHPQLWEQMPSWAVGHPSPTPQQDTPVNKRNSFMFTMEVVEIIMK